MSKTSNQLKRLGALLGVAAAGLFVSLPALAGSADVGNSSSTQVSQADDLAPSESMGQPDAPAEGSMTPAEPPPAQPNAPAQTPPTEAPANEPMDETMSPSEAPMSESVTPDELEQFANVVPELQAIQQSAQAGVAAAIEESGLTRERFSELYQAQESPEAASDATASPEEQQSFSVAFAEIQQIEQEIQSQREQVLADEGLDLQRFNEILGAIQQDPSLQQQVQEMLTN